MLRSALYFLLAGLCEIGGGYLVWIWLREEASIGYAVGGAVLLALYGIVPTFQPAGFGRVYAAYGGVFVVLSLLWGWGVEGARPDRFDVIGAPWYWSALGSSCTPRADASRCCLTLMRSQQRSRHSYSCTRIYIPNTNHTSVINLLDALEAAVTSRRARFRK